MKTVIIAVAQKISEHMKIFNFFHPFLFHNFCTILYVASRKKLQHYMSGSVAAVLLWISMNIFGIDC